MKKQLIIVLSVLVSTGVFAQHDHSKMDHSKKSGMQKSMTVSKDFQSQLNNVLSTSAQLTESFISADVKNIAMESVKVKSTLTKVDMKLLSSSEAHMEWMMNLKEMNSSLDKIASTKDLTVQKQEYAVFNQALYKSIKSFGIGGGTAYYQHCPMALDNKGAFWVSSTEEIRNPYLGKKMLKCGSTKETLN